MIVKYTAPTQFDQACQGSVWKRDNGQERAHHWIQVNADETNPKWIRLGDFIEDISSVFLEDEDFIQKSLKMYQELNAKSE